MPKAAIFDVDGTLVDSNDLHAHAWREAFAHFGYDIPYHEIRHQIGKGGDQLIPVFLNQKALARDGDSIDRYKTQLFLREYLPRVRPFPKVRELFQRIRDQGTITLLATSAKGNELAAYQRAAEIEGLADYQVSSDETDRSKPHPDIFAAALQKLGGVSASDVIVIGDSPYDAMAATRIGLPVIGLLCGGFAAEELKRAGCCAIYEDPADLLRRFDQSPLRSRTHRAA